MTKKDIAHKYPWLEIDIDVEVGWFQLVSALCGRLQWYCDQHKIEYPKVRQIKEKFGALCFYIDTDPYNKHMTYGLFSIIGDYEAMSRFVCEKCGTTVNVGWSTGWIKSICESCFNSHCLNTEWKSENKDLIDYNVDEIKFK